MAPRRDRFDPEIVAGIMARLCHRFADREAILWRAGYEEDAWSVLEERMLVAMRDELARGSFATARAFVEEMVRARLALVTPSSETEDESSGAPTIARFDDTTASGPSTDTNEDPLEITMSSVTSRDGRKPPRR